MTAHQPALGTAIVIGASICGSSVTQLLASRFDRVVVLDRDQLPTERAPRKGVPHATQFHTLTVGGGQVLDEIFPGFLSDLIDTYGTPVSDPTYDTRYASKFGWFPRKRSGLRMVQPTRRLIEWYIRGRAAGHANVEFRPQIEVVGLDVDGGRVRGVHVRDVRTKTMDTLAADLVVDAGGRPSNAPEWLATAGYPRPAETVVNAHWGYATTYVRLPDDWDPGWKSLYMGPTISGEGPAATRGAAMWPQEDHLMVITAQGTAGDLPPGDLDSLLEWLQSFGTTEFADMIRRYGAVRPVEAWRNTTNRLRDYAGVESRPEGFVVLGDAAAAFNPIYGQGMTLAAMSARLLATELDTFVKEHDDDLQGFAEAFQHALGAVLAPIWSFSTSSDFNIPGVEVDGVPLEGGKDPAAEYGDRVLALATEDPVIHRTFMESVGLVRTFEWLADPELQARVRADWDRLGSLRRGAEPAFTPDA